MSSQLITGIGLDIGSTTVKAVAAVEGRIVHRAYRRHRGRCLEAARAMLAEAPAGGVRIATGSGGAGLAGALDALYVHEVHAVAAAVRATLPEVRTVIELGGQDAKMIHLDDAGGFSSEMNERCAAGTGSVLDRCLHRLGLEPAALATLELPNEQAPPMVSAKCGVFAEADLVALVKAGRSTAEVLAALLDAVVRGNLTALARGRPLVPGVALLGGPHAFVPALASLWRRRLAERWRARGLEPGEVIVPEGAEYFAARGALLCAEQLRRVAAARGRNRRPDAPAAPRTEGARLGVAPAAAAPPRTHPASAGPLVLGLDAGSTTLKAVALDSGGVPVATAYRPAAHNPLEDARALLAQLALQLGPDATIAAFGVTGYAADLVGPVLGADATPVETLAHARSARHYVPDAAVVCDVGGQDIKVLLLDQAGVRGFRLSQQCAAGNGALLEAAAFEFGVPIERYAEVALSARRAPQFSVGCAVFLDTERVSAQRDGYTPAEILAGLVAVLPRNIWENVAAANDLCTLGEVFVLSGGVQRNAAAVSAQTDYLTQRHPRARILVHPWPGEAGAIGAALAAREAVTGPSRFIGFSRVAQTRWEAATGEPLRCRACLSACARTRVTAVGPTGERKAFTTGHGCERGESFGLGEPGVRPPRVDGAPTALNLLRTEATQLFGRVRTVRVVSQVGSRLRFGLPRVLPMYRAAPLFTHYLEALGVPRDGIVTGSGTSEELWRRFAGRGTVDACYPAKLAQAHVAALLADRAARPFDVMFFPALTHALTAVTGCADTASCPVVAGTPLVTRTAFGVDADGRLPDGTALLSPTLALCNHTQLSRSLFASMKTVMPALTQQEHAEALVEGFAAQRAFEASLEQAGADAIRAAAATRRCAIVMLGRPYHADPGLHHELGSELQALGRTTLSLRALPKKPEVLEALECGPANDLAEAAPSLTNSGDGEKLSAARLVASHPFLVALEVSSFKCGQDAALYGAIADLARQGGKPFLALHDLDETRPVASLRLRLRTFLDSVERWEQGQAVGTRGTG